MLGHFSVEIIRELIGAKAVGLTGEQLIDLKTLVVDSRKVNPGCGFVAIKGSGLDGHNFLQAAFTSGAAWAVVEQAESLGRHPGFVVSNTRLALSQLAALSSSYASQKLKTIGVTGTNGKTTTNWLIYHALNDLKLKCLRIGTLGIEAEGILSMPGDLTTPDPIQLQAVMRLALDAGCQACVMETSSHALDQYRVDHIQFDVGVFTNLTRDHLDYHRDMQAYFQAKAKLFELLARSDKPTKASVINLDSVEGLKLQALATDLQLRDFSFGLNKNAKIRILEFNQDISGSQLTLRYLEHDYTIHSGFIGRHNSENIAAVFATLVALGFSPELSCKTIEKLPQVPGRLEQVGTDKLGVYVDYAHTPDALEHALLALRELTVGRLWVVFGCGGDRDRGKRPQMGKVAAALANCVVVTSDNPRTEDPNFIIQDILASGIKATIVDANREQAIYKTLAACKLGDVVLIAGKGHEDYQIIGKEKIHFSDQELAKKFLLELAIA